MRYILEKKKKNLEAGEYSVFWLPMTAMEPDRGTTWASVSIWRAKSQSSHRPQRKQQLRISIVGSQAALHKAEQHWGQAGVSYACSKDWWRVGMGEITTDLSLPWVGPSPVSPENSPWIHHPKLQHQVMAEWPREGPLPQRPGEVEDRARRSVGAAQVLCQPRGASPPSSTHSDTILIRIKGEAKIEKLRIDSRETKLI